MKTRFLLFFLPDGSTGQDYSSAERDCEAAGQDKGTKGWCVWPSVGTIYKVGANIYDPQGANLPPSKGQNIPPNNREGK